MDAHLNPNSEMGPETPLVCASLLAISKVLNTIINANGNTAPSGTEKITSPNRIKAPANSPGDTGPDPAGLAFCAITERSAL